MNTKEKIALSTGACVLAGFIGYCIHKYREARKSIPKETEEDDWKSDSDEEAKISLYDLMDNVLVEGVSSLLLIAKNLEEAKAQCEYSEESLAQLKAYLEQQFTEIEVKQCKENDWNVKDYADEIELRQNNNDQEVIRRINIVEDVIKDVLSDRRPKVEFKLDPNLTPETTLILYAWILLIHGYSTYKELRRAVVNGDNLKMRDEELNAMITEAVDKTRENRR